MGKVIVKVIYENPVDKLQVFKVENYINKSAVDYAAENSLLDIILVK